MAFWDLNQYRDRGRVLVQFYNPGIALCELKLPESSDYAPRYFLSCFILPIYVVELFIISKLVYMQVHVSSLSRSPTLPQLRDVITFILGEGLECDREDNESS